MTTPRAKKSKQRSKPVERGRTASDVQTEDRKAKLGTKYVCYSCGARFYDLNQPEPLCPKCGTDQRTKPKDSPASSSPPPVPPKRPPPRPMPGLLDEEEEVVPFEEDMDLDLGDLDTTSDELFEEDTEPPEAGEDEPEEP